MKNKISVLDIEGKKIKEIDSPEFFNQAVREDLILKVLEAKKIKQPYSPSPVGGKQHSASGTLIHRRHVWKSQYGRGMSRIPRKSMSRRGTQFNWVGAEVPNTRGGRRAHPPKILAMINTNKINKKELQLALISALSATANEKFLMKKYQTLSEDKNKNIKSIEKFPIVIEDKITKQKTKPLLESLGKILGGSLFDVAVRNKTLRSGKGKMRNRKYKTSAGMLLVIGEKENLKTSVFDVRNVKNLSINDLAKGGPGRLVVYTESAIKFLENKLK